MDLPSYGLRCGGVFIAGMRTSWYTEADGEFYCAACGGDRDYRRRAGVRRLTVLNVPLLRRGAVEAVAECGTCHTRYDLDVLELPTSARFSAMLRDAVRTVALTVLGAGGPATPAARATAARVVREAGGPGADPPPVHGAVEAAEAEASGTGRPGAWLSIELHEALEPLACHLAPQGREHILLQGARVALADGPYRPAEREALAAVGHCLGLPREDTDRLLQAAATAS